MKKPTPAVLFITPPYTVDLFNFALRVAYLDPLPIA